MVTQLVKNSEKKYANVIKVWPFYSNLNETKKKYFLEINEKDNYFDAVMCVGTFTFGHVKPPALDEFDLDEEFA